MSIELSDKMINLCWKKIFVKLRLNNNDFLNENLLMKMEIAFILQEVY
jgi:hypothetical protein